MTGQSKPAPVANIDRLHRGMDEHGLDAIIARSGVNFTYLSGIAYSGTLARHQDLSESPRPVFLVWPRRGRPVIVLNALADALTRRDSWVEHVVLYGSYVDDPLQALAGVLKDLGLADARVGFEENYLTVSQCTALTTALPRLRLVECTRMMEWVRVIKTPGEIELIKAAADLLDDAFLEVYASIMEHDTEREVHSRMVGSCLRCGATFAHGWMASHRNTVPAGGQSDAPFLLGDVVRTDYVAFRRGYPGHQSRNAVIGRPSADQIRDYRKVRDVYLATMDHCRPGVLMGDVYAGAAERFDRAGFSFRAPLVGHSVGCWWHQQEPIICRGSRRAIEAGMVLAIEPYVAHWITQDLIAITADGPRLISDKFSTEELFAI
jgi:Xaa-Pro aminopeptidase